MSTATLTDTDVIERLSEAPGIDELKAMTRTSLSDLLRFGATITTQVTGTFGAGENACALSAIVLAREALRKK